MATLGVADRVTVHRGDALRYAERLGSGAFDLALADPPYGREDAARLVALFRRTPFARILSVEIPQIPFPHPRPAEYATPARHEHHVTTPRPAWSYSGHRGST